MDYSHLFTGVADIRYALASHYLCSFKNMVEIGGHRLIDFFTDKVFDETYYFVHVDPVLSKDRPNIIVDDFFPAVSANISDTVRNIGNHKIKMDPIFSSDRTKNALCLLGLEIYDSVTDGVPQDEGEKSMSVLTGILSNFSCVVLDYVTSNPVSNKQAHELHETCLANEMQLTHSFTFNFSHDAGCEFPNSSFHKERCFRVYDLVRS